MNVLERKNKVEENGKTHLSALYLYLSIVLA